MMHPSKAHGPDGFHVIFYQKYWDIVAAEVTSLAFNFLNGGGSIKEINQIFIVIISKIKNAMCMSDFRPITLCNVLYKIIVKTIANRLK